MKIEFKYFVSLAVHDLGHDTQNIISRNKLVIFAQSQNILMLSQSCFSNRAVKIFFVESEIEEMNLIFLFSLIAVFSQFASGIQWKCEFKVIDEKEFCVLDEFEAQNIHKVDLNNVEFDEFAITGKVVNLKIEFFKLKSFPI